MTRTKYEIPFTITPQASGISRTVLVPVLANDRKQAAKLAAQWLTEHGWLLSEFQLWEIAK